MASLRPSSLRPSRLRREAMVPLPAATRFPFLLIVATAVVLLAAVTDAVVWTQGSERRALVRQAQDAHVEAELLRYENDRLRQRNLELSIAIAEAEAEAEACVAK